MTLVPKNLKKTDRDIRYINKDFTSFRDNLIEYTKTYFPKSYADFNESSPGMLFIEMASYIGDVLSYYIDDTLKESLMVYAEDETNVRALSTFLGYKPKVTKPSVVTLSVYQLVPSIGNGINNKPDSKFYLRIKRGMLCKSTKNNISFSTTDMVDFNDSTDREITVFQVDAITNEPTFYLVKKYVKATSSNILTDTFTFGSYTPYNTINLSNTNVIDIISVTDSEGNKYYEVPYLAQEMIYADVPNVESNDSDLYQFKDTVPYLLKMIKTPRRFTTTINSDNTTTIQFGVSNENTNSEVLIPNFKNVGLGLPNSNSKLDASFDPTNFLKTNTYGISPSNTTITVVYSIGGGVSSNVPSNDITTITGIEYDDSTTSFSSSDLQIYNTMKSSVAIKNETPASGGGNGDTIDEIRENALANFGSQNRAVTTKDYQIRSLAMPAKYGAISKVFAIADGNLDNNSPSSILASPNSMQEFTTLVQSLIDTTKTQTSIQSEKSIKESLTSFLSGKQSNSGELNNPFAVNLYTLGYDDNKNLTPLNRAVKENLKTYLNEYRMLTDGVNILDGFIINIGLNFEIIVYSSYNKTSVLAKCMSELKDYFNIDNWTFNKTINLSEIELILANVDGVMSVPMVEIVNKTSKDGNYSVNGYNILEATKNKIIYPSLDPSVFEIKYPDLDIKGKVR